jgi:hypothetical protein
VRISLQVDGSALFSLSVTLDSIRAQDPKYRHDACTMETTFGEHCGEAGTSWNATDVSRGNRVHERSTDHGHRKFLLRHRPVHCFVEMLCPSCNAPGFRRR